MRKSLNATLFIVMVLTGWLISYWITRSHAIASDQQENPVWMQNVPNEIVDSEETFRQWMQKNAKALKQQQVALGQLLDDPQSTDQSILQQAERIALTHEELLRGVGTHIQTMRSSLPDAQKQLLNGFCRQTLRGPMHRNKHCMQEQGCMQRNQGTRAGRGNGFGRQRRQGRCGLTRKLQLTEDQLTIAAQKDPAFEQEVQQLQSRLLTERQALLSLLESQQEPNGQVSEQIERIITAHNALEKRLISYVVIMREHFTAEQQKRLIGLCQRNCSTAP